MGVGWFSVAATVAALAAQLPGPKREQIVVTGTWEPIPLEEADRSVRALPVRPLLVLHSCWTDFLRADPALDVRARAPHGVQNDLSIRGATFGQTLVLLDGMRLNDPQTGHHSLDLPVPMEAISRIEVLRGSGSTLYGADAVGGVVHFITAKPEASEWRVKIAGGNHGSQQQSLLVEAMRGGWSQRLSAARDFSTGFRPNRDYRSLALASMTRRDARAAGTALLLAHSDRPFGAEGFYGPYPSWERTRTWFGALEQRWSDTRFNLAFRRHTDLFVLDRARPEFYTNRHRATSWQGTFRRARSLGLNSRLHLGLEAYRDAIVSTNLGTHGRSRAAGYAAWDVRALGRYSFSLGARQESYHPGVAPFSPSASAGAWLGPHIKLRAAIGRAFRLPTFTDLYYRDPVTRGSPELRPESAWTYEGGLDLHKGHLHASLTLFERRERDGIDYVRRPGDQFWQAMNFERLRMRGCEIGLRATPVRAQQLDMAWTVLGGARQALGDWQSRYVFNYPSHAFTANWQGQLGHRIIARSRLSVYKRLARAPYLVWDIAFAWQGARLRPLLQAYNLTGARYEEIAGVPMPGRSLIAGVEVAVAGPRR